MTHDFHGRKIKKKKVRGVVYDKYTPPAFKELVVADGPYRRSTPEYKSASAITLHIPAQDTSYKRDISSQYTIAPAYNKGAYQVISCNDIKHIGK